MTNNPKWVIIFPKALLCSLFIFFKNSFTIGIIMSSNSSYSSKSYFTMWAKAKDINLSLSLSKFSFIKLANLNYFKLPFL